MRNARSGAKLKRPKDTPSWMDCAWKRIPCNKQNCRLCGKISADRQRHIENGEDPDDLKYIFEDVGNSLKDALKMIEQDAKRLGIEITNISTIKEPPEPEKFSLYKKVNEWREMVYDAAAKADAEGNLWPRTEAGEDLLWYSNTLTVKTYRQLCNIWHIKNGDEYGEFDHKYTEYVLGMCLNILNAALRELAFFNSNQKGELMLALSKLPKLEKQIIKL